jgi:predicted nucleic acid-binding Zn ribbon protein
MSIHAIMPWDDPDVQVSRPGKTEVAHGEDKPNSPFYSAHNACPICDAWIRDDARTCQDHRFYLQWEQKLLRTTIRRAHEVRLTFKGIPPHIALALVKRGLYDNCTGILYDSGLPGQPVRPRGNGGSH